MLARAITVVVAALLVPACVSEPLPEPARRPAAPLEVGSLTRELVAAEFRHAQGIECGTQYMFTMRDLARQAPDHLPELVDALRTGTGQRHALFILYLMKERAALVLPLLEELSHDSDAGVRARAAEGIKAVEEALQPDPTPQPCGS